MPVQVDTSELTQKVQRMYRAVATEPGGEYHFELGRPLAERLGYPPDALDRIPPGAIESFAGVGYFFDLAGLAAGESVVDLGCGSGLDLFIAATQVGTSGSVVGVDFTAEQLAKARRLAAESGFVQVQCREGRIERVPAGDASADCVISNGVINLSSDKAGVFAEAARVLRPGGRLAIADIVTEQQLKDSIVCDVDLWASCIGGAAQQDAYREAIEAAGLSIERIRENPYEFISQRARDAPAVRYATTTRSGSSSPWVHPTITRPLPAMSLLSCQQRDALDPVLGAGVRLALRGYADRIRAGQEPPVERVHAQFVDKGGRFYVCPICFNERDLDRGQLVEGAELQGATPLMEFAGDAAMTFNY